MTYEVIFTYDSATATAVNILYTILDGSSVSGILNSNSSKFGVRSDQDLNYVTIITGQYSIHHNVFIFKNPSRVQKRRLNHLIVKIWDTSVSVSLNNSEWETQTSKDGYVNFPTTHTWGYSPITIDAFVGETFTTVGLFREFPFLIDYELK